MITELLGASWRTGICGIILIAFSIALFYMARIEEAIIAFTTGIALMKSRDSAATSEQQVLHPGLLNQSPDVTMTDALKPTINQAVEQKVEEVVTPRINELEEKKVDK